MRTRRGATILALSALAGCGDPAPSNPFDVDTAITNSTTATTTQEPTTGEDTSASAGTSAATTSGGSADEESGGIKLDVAAGDVPGPCVGEGCNEGCTSVDLVFVIDNSGSMGDYQAALGLAFPAFAATLDSTLPAGTNLHVGVTSTEMGYSGSGSTSIMNGNCTFTGDGGQPNSSFYITPDVTDTGRNGAQGRLYDPGGGQTFYDYTIGAGGAALTGLETWFSSAANIGTGGSNIEMSTAPAGWVADAANDATNAGFIRDQGSVLVVFFMQDEPDQTPLMIGGMPGGLAMLDKLVAAKAGCGGTDCIIAGGFLNENACSAMGNLPLDDFLANVGEAPIVQPLPDENLAEDDPQAAADEMNMVLSGTLAEVIAQTCEQIGPEG
ncbi:hypothetical protein [Paraliomyxa miuraensis]|uniref:hypothetical protein n=1 Tax=Paraliomyxa miuraensis TaxID=376150 RepID=UPI00224CEC69|nr:hypothetical protein [Paraliomyxa miuraensis]MCX4242683.1 hypothetical protein [Paraliomyxa miuraensis]